jgi:hypothetical protein
MGLKMGVIASLSWEMMMLCRRWNEVDPEIYVYQGTIIVFFWWSWLSLDMFRYPVKNFSCSAAKLPPLHFSCYSVTLPPWIVNRKSKIQSLCFVQVGKSFQRFSCITSCFQTPKPLSIMVKKNHHVLMSESPPSHSSASLGASSGESWT